MMDFFRNSLQTKSVICLQVCTKPNIKITFFHSEQKERQTDEHHPMSTLWKLTGRLLASDASSFQYWKHWTYRVAPAQLVFIPSRQGENFFCPGREKTQFLNVFHSFIWTTLRGRRELTSYQGTPVKVCPHLYANANEACGTEANQNKCQKVVCLAFAYLNVRSALRTYFSLKYRLQIDSIWLFTECSPHNRMLFATPWVHVHNNIFLIYICLIRHSRIDVDAALHISERNAAVVK